MSASGQGPWSDNPNAPEISYHVYSYEKANFAGILIGSILYGIVVVLFFKCMTSLFNPANRRGEGVKWGLVSYTVIIFSAATIFTAMNSDLQTDSYIDNRGFLGVKGVAPPGPLGYQLYISSGALNVVPTAMITLSDWLADGLLLYRCYVIYAKSLWVIAFPCLVYIGSVVMGVMFVYQTSDLASTVWSPVPYFSISLSLNVLLTLMIIVRLIWHARSVRGAMGINGSGGLCKAIITMLVESCALDAVSSLLVLGPWSAHNMVEETFLPILAETQVIAPLFVIHRIANKSALTSETIASAHIGSFKARSREELTDGSGALTSEDPSSSVDERGIKSSELKAVR